MCNAERDDPTVLRELAAREQRLRSILGSLPDVVLILDAEGRYREVLSESPYLIAPAATLVGRTIREMLPRSAARSVQEVIDRTLATGEVQDHEYSLEIRGTQRHFQARVVPFPGETYRAVLWVARDISGIKAEELARRELETRMQDAQRLESLGILAGGIAHDFNNLLVGMLSNTAIVLAALPPDSPHAPPLRDVERSALRASEMCQEMLAYAGRGEVERRRIELDEIIADVHHLVGASISKQVSLSFQLASPAPVVDADATQLRQVLMNLATNASEALDDGIGSIRIATGRRIFDADELQAARPAALPPGDYVYLEVADSGCGMDEEQRKRIFEPFFSTKFAGRGLGMASVMGIVRRHDGALQVESAPGRGTTVRVLFPPAAEVRPQPEPPEEGAARPTTVLCIDDEEVVRNVVGRVLGAAGFEVMLAADALSGLELFGDRGRDIDALVVDASMPRMNGREVVARVRRQRPELPILVISGHDDAQLQEQFAGQDVALLKKPFLPDALRDAVRSLLA